MNIVLESTLQMKLFGYETTLVDAGAKVGRNNDDLSGGKPLTGQKKSLSQGRRMSYV